MKKNILYIIGILVGLLLVSGVYYQYRENLSFKDDNQSLEESIVELRSELNLIKNDDYAEGDNEGADITDGANGDDGTDGVNGDDGADGVSGDDGADGVSGDDGTDGVNGVDGTDGEPGISGYELVLGSTYDITPGGVKGGGASCPAGKNLITWAANALWGRGDIKSASITETGVTLNWINTSETLTARVQPMLICGYVN